MVVTITGRLPSVSSGKSQDSARAFTHFTHLPSMRGGVYTNKTLVDLERESARFRVCRPPRSEVVTAVNGVTTLRPLAVSVSATGGNSGVNFTLGGPA